MAEYITIKSRATQIYDYRQVDISQFLTGFTPAERQLSKDMTRWLRRFGKTVSVNAVEPGDTAVLRCQSSLPRFQKASVTVPVGKGLFDRELETKLIGMTVGETRTLTTGETAVEVTVLSVSRVRLPERTDAAIAALGVEGIGSLQDLRVQCLKKQVEGFLLEDENPDMASAYVWQEVAKNSRFAHDEGECRLIEQEAEKRWKKVAQQYPDGMDSITIDTFRHICMTELDLATIGQQMLRQENALLTTADYEARLTKLQEAYPEKSRSQLMEEETPFTFACSHYADILAQRMDEYVGQCFMAHFAR